MTAATVGTEPAGLAEFLAGLAELDTDARKAAARARVPALVDVPAVIRQGWRDALGRHAGLAAREFDELHREARAARLRVVGDDQGAPDDGAPPGSRRVPGLPDWRFVPSGQPGEGLWKLGRDRWVRALDWCADVRERLVMLGDDGTASALHYLIGVGPDEQVVSHEAIRKGEAWDVFPDATGMTGRTAREAMAAAVTAISRELPRTTVVNRTGGHVIDGRRVYVRPDGRTVPEGAPVRLVGVGAELARLAAPAPREAAPAELVTALREISRRGWSPLLALGIGARAAGWSIRPVRAGYMVAGDPGGGKSLTTGMARWLYLDLQWPPLATVSFSASVTEIEFALAGEADFPAVMEDLALPANAHSGEVARATEKIDRLYRALANDTEVRGRRSRDLSKRPGNRIRTILGANMQTIPHSVQESLYRRSVVLYVERGDNDVKWYAEHSRAMLPVPLRTIGDRVLARLWAGDADQARAELAACDAAGYHLIGAAMDDLTPGWSTSADQFRGVVEAAGAYLGGLRLVADAAGVEFAELAGAVVGPLARSLARQWQAMRDVRDATDDLGTAVAEMVRRAMADQRAHVRDVTDVAGPVIPGQTVQSQGLRELIGREGPMGWDGKGAAFYWLPALGAVGVRSAELHTLLAAYRDPRTDGYTSHSLPKALLRTGFSLRSGSQRDPAGTHQVRIGAGDGAVPKKRLILMPAGRVWDMGDEDRGDPAELAEPGPAGPGDQGAEPDSPAAPFAEPGPAELVELVELVEPRPAETGSTCQGFAATPGDCAGCNMGGARAIYRGRLWHPGCWKAADAAHAMEAAHRATVRAAEQPAQVPAAPAPVVVQDRPAEPVTAETDPAELANFARVIRKPDAWPDATDADVTTAHALFREATGGLRMIGDPGFVGVQWYRWVRDRHGSSARAAAARAEQGEQPDALRSDLIDAITSGGDLFRFADHVRPGVEVEPGARLVALDVSGAYLAAAASTELGDREPARYGSTRSIRQVTGAAKWSKSPGYVRLGSAPKLAAPVPALGQLGEGSWLPTPWVDFLLNPWPGRGPLLASDLDIAELVIWHRQGPDGRPQHGRRLATWQGQARDARAALATAPGLPGAYARRVSKAVYTAFLGGYLRSERYNRTELLRPDWSDMVIGQTGANLMRKVTRGHLDHGDAHPIGIYRDDVWYLADQVPAGMAAHVDNSPGAKLGTLKTKGIITVTDELAEAIRAGSALTISMAIAAILRGAE